jgi:small subunit ribosomal protein S6
MYDNRSNNNNDMNGFSLRENSYDMEKDRKMFSRKKSCWFCAKKAGPDWKDTSTYSWLVNEFGKVSPARISGLCCRHQREGTLCVKRGRNMGLLCHVSNETAR